MKTALYFLIFLISTVAYSQFKADENIIISEKQYDDIYLSGQEININAPINGDAVIAGGLIIVKDTISQDLIIAGGDITVKGYVNDDIRAAGGNLIIDSVVGDDVILFGGDTHITENTTIHGNLIAFSGTIRVDGTIMGNIKAYGEKLEINGKILKDAELYAKELNLNAEITGTTKIVSENVEIGNHAKFFDNIQYWSKSKVIDFKNSLINTSADFNEDLNPEQHKFSWGLFGVAALVMWIFYVLFAFLIIVILNALFRSFLSKTILLADKKIMKSLFYGFIYLIGLPLLIIICFAILIGIPIGLLLVSIYLFSILIGHIVVALLITHYFNKTNQKSWGIWKLSFIALGIAIAIRFFTLLLPFLGTLISITTIAIAYGLIIQTLKGNKNLKTLTDS